MDNQIATPTSFSEGNASAKTSKKSFIIFAVGFILIIAIIIGVVVLIAQNKKNDATLDTGNVKGEVSYISNSNYPAMLNLYANMYDNMTINDLDKLISKSGYSIRKDTDDDDDAIVYLASSTAMRKTNGSGACLYDTDYVKYIVDKQEELTEEQEPTKWATAIEYHECVAGADTYIMELNEGKFRNFTGTVTIDYDSKEDAILNQLSVRQK